MEYRIDMSRFGEVRKQVMVKTIPLMLLAGATGIGISLFGNKDGGSTTAVLPFVIPMSILALGYGLYLGIRRQKELMASYRLTISGNIITREQGNTPTISIYFSEVKQILKGKNGGMVVAGKNPADVIIIPAQIERATELETELSSIMAVATAPPLKLLQKYPRLLTIIVLGLMVCVFTATNKRVVAVSGIMFVAFFAWAFMIIKKNKNIDGQTKKKLWIAVLPAAAAIVRVVAILVGYH